MKKIAIINYKGGVGKSTVSLLTSKLLQKNNKNVILADADVQKSLAEHADITSSDALEIYEFAESKNAEYVVIDTAPRDEVAQFLKTADKFIIVADIGKATQKITNEFIKTMLDVGIQEHNMFFVLNRVPINKPSDALTSWLMNYDALLLQRNIYSEFLTHADINKVIETLESSKSEMTKNELKHFEHNVVSQL